MGCNTRDCPLLKDTIQPPVKWQQSDIPAVSPIICLLIYHTQLPCAMFSCPRRTLATSNGLSSHVPQGVSRHKDTQPPVQKLLEKRYIAKRKTLLGLCGKDWVQDENINLKFQMGWSHTLQVCASVHRPLLWQCICMCGGYIHMYIQTLVHVHVYIYKIIYMCVCI